MIRAVIFDLGHTLWDIGPQRGALERAYADMRRTLVLRLGREDLPEAAAFQAAFSKAEYTGRRAGRLSCTEVILLTELPSGPARRRISSVNSYQEHDPLLVT